MNESIRPQFLTILCVLTFISSGWGIINAISTYKNPEVAVGIATEMLESVMDNIDDEVNTNEVAGILESVLEEFTVENLKNQSLANAIASLLTLIGAVLMWGLDKKGFWLYLAGTAVAIIAPLMIYDGIMGMATSGGSAFIGILFSVLYFLNLKHLK